jgi:acetyl-CoA carboxylase carboxyl transferase subunit alpha
MTENKNWNIVLNSRLSNRPKAKDLIDYLIDDFVELHGDFCSGDDASMIGGIGFLDDIAITVISQQKGSNIDERIMRNFGMPHPEGYRKAVRLMKQAEKFKRPILTIVDTPGAYPGIKAEEGGQAKSIADSLFQMIEINTPIISLILGEGGSGGALAISISDRMIMMENSYFSLISPEGLAAILYNDRYMAQAVSKDMKIFPKDLLKYGIADIIVDENSDWNSTFNFVKDLINKYLLELNQDILNDVLIVKRKQKYENHM